MKNIMQEVKVLRTSVGTKQYVLANLLGIDQSNYSNIENGKLITNNLPEIKKKAIEILLPMLNEKIKLIKSDLEYYESLKNNIQKSINS